MKFGYFDDQNKEYVITTPQTPLPWINYLGSEDFFSLVSNTAGGYSFYRDARMRRLTRYRYNNSPLDMDGHRIYIKDGDTVWNPGWQPTKTPLDSYSCRHGLGYTILEGKKDAVCLDVNVLNPESAFQRFENPEVGKVIALTYSQEVADRGNNMRKDDNVRFFATQFEADDFEDKLESYLDSVGADGIDFVCLSMAIMDFKKPFRILQAIRNCLNDDAVMIIRDVDDGAVFAYPDNDGLFRKMQSYYIHNKYSGFRYTGRQIYSYVRKMEPKTICLEKYGINTADMSRKDKKMLFEAWFSFIPNDFGRMLRENPDSKISREVVDFCQNHYDELNEQFFSNETIFSAGYVIYSVRF